jgi:hypothetical protein
MRFCIVGLALYGLYAILARFVPGLLLQSSIGVVVIAALVAGFAINHRVK